MSALSQFINPEQEFIFSKHLGRYVTVTVLAPGDLQEGVTYPLILFNDGQDFGELKMAETFSALLAEGLIGPAVIAGIHADSNRLHEYGIAAHTDYAGRGSRAADTTSFVIEELVPFLSAKYGTVSSGITYAGFSLGGLMALDATWTHPEVFSQTGIFSGALWWRRRALCDDYDPSDRIMHAQIRETDKKPDLRFWFQCGTWDELDDRDMDGIIDSIQDTLECVAELERKGYRWGKSLCYREVPQGRHDQETWSRELPAFLVWAGGYFRSGKLG